MTLIRVECNIRSLGVGMGMAVAAGVPSMVGRGAGPMAAPAAEMPPPPPSWHIAEDGAAAGPFSAPQLVEAISSGRIAPETLVWMAGMPEWVAASQVPQLAGLFGATPPPLPAG